MTHLLRRGEWLRTPTLSSSNQAEIEEAPMPLSIVIPTLNESTLIQQNIQHYWELRPHEVIVADGRSDDGTADLARSSGATDRKSVV